MAKKTEGHDPDHVAVIAATLLHGHHDAEPHHIRHAITTARLLLDEAHGIEPEPVAEPEPAEVEVQPEGGVET